MTAVVIPCFNEAARIDVAAMSAAARDGRWKLLFVDDGSTDTTPELLEGLRRAHPDCVSVLRLPRNVGKGEAVRRGMLTALEADADLVAYLDADLSTSFGELSRLVDRLRREAEIDVVLGSRVLRLGADIRRSLLRHLTGRVYATIASLALGVGVYDTQCGAKAFRGTPRLAEALKDPFSERWAFDVEMLSRLVRRGETRAWAPVVEEPLLVWHDCPGSKLRPLAAIRAAAELARIGYRRRRR